MIGIYIYNRQPDDRTKDPIKTPHPTTDTLVDNVPNDAEYMLTPNMMKPQTSTVLETQQRIEHTGKIKFDMRKNTKKEQIHASYA